MAQPGRRRYRWGVKVAICTPCHSDTRASFTDSLGKMLIHAGRQGACVAGQQMALDLELFMAGSADLAAIRELLAEMALAADADWLLWLDSDQTFPPDTLARLLAAGRPVVGCNIAQRSDPTGPTASRIEDGALVPVWTDAAKAEQGEIERVDVIGLGVCLVSTALLRALPRPWFRFEPPGEDVYFCASLRAAGIHIFVDHGLSWEVGHIALRTLTNADTVADKDRWLQRRNSPP
jgi:hypothetical protein